MAQTSRIVGVDIGNSGLRIAELDSRNESIRLTQRISWLHVPHVATPSGQNAKRRFSPDSDAWLAVIEDYVAELGSECQVQWLVSSVRRDASKVLEQYVASRCSDRWRAITRHDLSLTVDVQEPDKVGIDRLLAAAAASRLFSVRPLIVMQVGSALTVDLVAEPNVFCGGAILPGVPMMLRLLGQAADMLPTIDADELTELPSLPGRNTEQAMHCGTASALVGGAIHLVQRYRQQYGDDTLIVLSGGDGMRLAQHLDSPMQIVPNLVLQGLLPIASGDSPMAGK